MKKIFFLVILVFTISIARSQTISGYVFSTPEKTPVEFANVLILNLPDSSMVKGIISYMDGKYTADKLNPGKYYLKASIVGYQNNGISIEITDGQKNLAVDTIFLSVKTNTLAEVVVKGDMVRAKELVDRTVYEILPEVEKTSTNGYDVLKKIPSVQVDFNNNVTLNGKSNFIIQVDGKQRDKEFLARILPSDIETIEIINNPSGKYEGTIDGVINVILKKEARVGVNGNFGTQVKPIGKTTLGAMGSLDYGREKITFYVSGYSFIQNLDNITNDYSRITLVKTNTSADSILNLTGNGSFGIVASSINTGFDFYLNEKNNFSFNYSYKPFSLNNKLSNTGDIFLNDSLANYQITKSDIYSESGESNISLFYRKKFKKPIQELTVESNYYSFNSSDDNTFNDTIHPSFSSSILELTKRNDSTKNHRDYFSTKIDYVHPVGVTVRLEAGYQFYLQNMESTFLSSFQTLDTSVSQSNNFNYAELRNAGYASFFWNLKDFSLQTTLRFENSRIRINDEITSHYNTWLPSANLLYKINSKQNIKFTFNSRINRPDIYNLNPFEKLNNNLSVSAGNPSLKPELRDKLQLTYSLNVKKINISPYVYYENYKDKIDYRTFLNKTLLSKDSTLYSSPDNLLTGYEQGIGLNATLWSFNINGSFYKGHFNEFSDSLSTISTRNYLSYRLTSYVYAPLFKNKVNVFGFVSFDGVSRTAETKTYSPLIYGFGAQQNIKNHSIGFFYLLPFSKELVYSKSITETPVIYAKNINSFETKWFVQVMYSYKFNKGRAIKKTEKKTEIESDTKGGGLGR